VAAARSLGGTRAGRIRHPRSAQCRTATAGNFAVPKSGKDKRKPKAAKTKAMMNEPKRAGVRYHSLCASCSGWWGWRRSLPKFGFAHRRSCPPAPPGSAPAIGTPAVNERREECQTKRPTMMCRGGGNIGAIIAKKGDGRAKSNASPVRNLSPAPSRNQGAKIPTTAHYRGHISPQEIGHPRGGMVISGSFSYSHRADVGLVNRQIGCQPAAPAQRRGPDVRV